MFSCARKSHEKKLPADLFWWEGADGTRLLTYRIPYSYGIHGPVQDRLRDFISDLQEPTKGLMVFYGAGDHGGGASQGEHPIHPGHAETDRVHRQFFSAPRTITLTRSASSPISRSWPTISSITPWAATRQCRKSRRTTGPRRRRWLRERKWRLLLPSWPGLTIPRAEFTAAWKKVLFMQFHDSMAGTRFRNTTLWREAAHGYALEVANQAINLAAEKIAWQIPAARSGLRIPGGVQSPCLGCGVEC